MKASLYPTKIEQPNANESSGLAGRCLKEVRRDKSVHKGNCTTQKDPKYHHAWSNVSQLKEGKGAQCGRTSSYHCSHKTYYGIKGYRNTCPIAGVNGTYTQPATLRLYFNPQKKKIPASSKINKIKISISHRCTGVDVANNKEYDKWGPNFSGFKTYPDRSVLTVKFAGQKKTTMTNPPLSKKNYDTISFTFKNVTYNHLANGYIDLIYGNNLSSNPGNIYIKNVFIDVDYDPEDSYFEGKQSSKTLFVGSRSECRSSIKFTLSAGFKNGAAKIPASKASKKYTTKDIKYTAPANTTVTLSKIDDTTIKAVLVDNSTKTGTKHVKFELKGTGLKKEFKYEAKARKRPEVRLPYNIEKNTKSDGTEGVVLEEGCASKLVLYDEGTSGLSYTVTGITFSEDSNLLSVSQKKGIYEWLSSLSCGYHEIFFRIDDEDVSKMTSQKVKIIPAKYNIYFTRKVDGVDTKFTSVNFYQNKEENKEIKIVFEPIKELKSKPTFSIVNPTTGVEKNDDDEFIPKKMENAVWSPETTGGTYTLDVGVYTHGDFYIELLNANNCTKDTEKILVKVISPHKQYFDEIFVRGEDGTAFDYEYLVAMEGDTLLQPIYAETLTLENTYKDFQICAKKENVTGLGEPSYMMLYIKNNKQESIKNLFLELNVLIENEEGNLEVTTSEWLDPSGIFFNFKDIFYNINPDLDNIIDIKNLSDDDDFIDEEDVYLHIKKINPGEQIGMKIPFFSYMEKNIYLEILLEGEPLLISSSCSSENPDTFDKIHLEVYDSVLTNMEITGDIDVLSPSEINCPLECFKTESGITYKIKNIDQIKLDELPLVIIQSDPRLVPYQYKEKNGEIKDIKTQSSYLNYISKESVENYNVTGLGVSLEISFPGLDKKTITQYTDVHGYTTFFIDIPKSLGNVYNVAEFKKICTLSAIGTSLTHNFEIIDDYTSYFPGETMPIKVKVTSSKTVFQNDFRFFPKIKNPGDSDEVTIYYKACNLKDNEGILKTSFKTNTPKLAQNEVNKEILFGVKTNTQCSSLLKEVVIEKNNINRLFLTIKNEDRFNKDVKIIIKEIEDIEKYVYSYSDIETGKISFEDNKLIWSIPYIEKDTTIRGYIDFKAENIGLSEMSIEVEDFLTNADIDFNKKNCDC